jgi:phenylacetate-CoA ligase
MNTSLQAYPNLLLMVRRPWIAPSALSKIQERKLRKLVRHAYENVPYYHELFAHAGVVPEDIRGLEDLHLIPPTSKEVLHELPLSERIAGNVDLNACQAFTTSGTSGIPLTSYFTAYDATMKNLSWIRGFLSSGARLSDKMAAFVGRERVRSTRSWYEYLHLWRRKEISSWDAPSSWVADLRAWKPRILLGYVMTLRILGEYIRDRGIRDIKPGLILHSSALLDSASRSFLQSVFECPIVDFYGSDEAGCIAWECERCGGYHVSLDTALVEVLNEGKPVSPGGDGEVVVTNLHSYAMPFIRYRQEDVVTVSGRKPACGRTFPLLESVRGRNDDFIVLRSGRRISPHPLYHSIDPVPGIKRWRIVQETWDRLRVEIEPAEGFSETQRTLLEANLRRVLKEGIELEIARVPRIDLHPSRKFRAVSSRLGGLHT